MMDGKKAERAACEYLRKKRYILLDYNYRSRFGEIDLIFEKREKFKSKYIVFVEVKMRDEASIAAPKEFVDFSKQQKLIMTAKDYLVKNKTDLQPRFDVVEVVCKKDGDILVKHLENAFTIS